ncbi:unnamed protein product [Owenia fusiformis]|uniref:Uncharacterized protein n=1 Tax=Owenia fusiformis TaxID=6347 RepID=A0A8J1US21_OWEFU|nr:unnamed protein product [Owenia fusiformis]
MELTGPFPKPKDYDTLKDYKIPTSTTNGIERLTEFVKYIASKINVKNRYTTEQLKEHTEYVEKFVKDFCIDFARHTPKGDLSNEGKPNPILESNSIIRRGSSYEGTKILSPSEYDFIPIFAWSFDAAISVEKVGKRCKLAGKGYGFINIKHGDLHQMLPPATLTKNQTDNRSISQSQIISSALQHLPLTGLNQLLVPTGKIVEDQPGMSGSNRSSQISSSSETFPQSQPCSSSLNTWVLIALNKAIDSFLSDSDRYDYIGQKSHDEDPESPYPQGTISLHEITHGTCVWLRIGAPICTTDIDLAYAVENMSETQKRCVMVGEWHVDCSNFTCKHKTHWTESLIHPGLHGDTIVHTLSTNHHHLFLVLKYINHLIQTNLKTKTYSSSYSYKMLLHQHQRGCQNENVGQCLEDIVNQFYTYEKQCIDTIETNTYNYNHLKEVPDINYPKRMIKLHNFVECAALLWIMQHVKHTTDTSWWDMLLHEDFKPKDFKEGHMLYSLLDIVQQVDRFKWNNNLKKGSVIDVEFLHEDNTKTVYRWIN